jgi:hypothetical protein
MPLCPPLPPSVSSLAAAAEILDGEGGCSLAVWESEEKESLLELAAREEVRHSGTQEEQISRIKKDKWKLFAKRFQNGKRKMKKRFLNYKLNTNFKLT